MTIEEQKERAELVRAMEKVCRHINDEDIIEGWLMTGVADGSVDDDTPWEDIYSEYCEDDRTFKDIMASFCRTMRRMVLDPEIEKPDRKLGNIMLYSDTVSSEADPRFYKREEA